MFPWWVGRGRVGHRLRSRAVGDYRLSRVAGRLVAGRLIARGCYFKGLDRFSLRDGSILYRFRMVDELGWGVGRLCWLIINFSGFVDRFGWLVGFLGRLIVNNGRFEGLLSRLIFYDGRLVSLLSRLIFYDGRLVSLLSGLIVNDGRLVDWFCSLEGWFRRLITGGKRLVALGGGLYDWKSTKLGLLKSTYFMSYHTFQKEWVKVLPKNLLIGICSRAVAFL